MDEYSDAHRHFVQALISRHSVSPAQLKEMYRSACARIQVEADGTQFALFLKTVNTQLRRLHLEVAKGVSDTDGGECYALVNRRAGEETLKCAGYPENNLRFLMAIIDGIVVSDSGYISSSDALNLVDRLHKRCSRSEAQNMLQTFVDHCWLEISPHGQVGLHTRCILELTEYLKDTYGDHVRTCKFCNRIVIRGVVCGQCEDRSHRHCVRKMRRGVDVVKCRSCQTVLPAEGERAGV